MKFTAVLASVLLFANTNRASGASLRVASLTEDLTKEDSSSGIQERELLLGDGHDDFEHRNLGQLRSKECAPMMKKMKKKMEEIANFNTKELKTFACSPVEWKMKTNKENKMEKDIKTQICIKAFKREMSKKKKLLLKTVGGSKEACEEELTKEVQAVKGETTEEAGAVETNDRTKKEFTVYSLFGVGPEAGRTVATFTLFGTNFMSYNAADGADGVGDPDGTMYNVVTQYNFADEPSPAEMVNDNKITMVFQNGDMLVLDTVWSLTFPQPIMYAITGGTGLYRGASGEVTVGTDQVVNMLQVSLD